jgi:indole-3-glycerol phosphate synthase
VTHLQTVTVLDQILTRTAADLAERKFSTPLSDLEATARSRLAPLSLRAALAGPDMSVIAEIKRASPSRGMFPVSVDPD